MCNNPQMLILDPSDAEELKFALNKAVKQSGLTLEQISKRLEHEYGVKLSPSAISHAIWRGSIRLQRALQILAVCGVTEVEIKP
jgi:hypothetical protein